MAETLSMALAELLRKAEAEPDLGAQQMVAATICTVFIQPDAASARVCVPG